MKLSKNLWTILIINLAYLIPAFIYYLYKKNYEFVAYVGVMFFFIWLILHSYEKIKYSQMTLWGLSIWGFFHMAGGCFYYNGVRWYSTILIPISEKYEIFRYDQAIHIFGFFVATLIAYEVIKTKLKSPKLTGFGLALIIAMAGLGFGAMNEIIEFIITVILPETGVGGYLNTSLDLVSDLIGAIIGVVVIKYREK